MSYFQARTDLALEARESISEADGSLHGVIAEETEKNVLAVSEEQTQGRGRQGKSFYSPPGGGVYFSLVIRPDGELNDIVFVTSAAAVAVAKRIASPKS